MHYSAKEYYFSLNLQLPNMKAGTCPCGVNQEHPEDFSEQYKVLQSVLHFPSDLADYC